MYQDRHSLLRLEKWTKWLRWYFLLIAALGFISTVFRLIDVWKNPLALGANYWENNIWYKSLIFTRDFRSVFFGVFAFLLLTGISKAIRYLLALEAEIRSKGTEYPS
jgi:hypothetical protein